MNPGRLEPVACGGRSSRRTGRGIRGLWDLESLTSEAQFQEAQWAEPAFQVIWEMEITRHDQHVVQPELCDQLPCCEVRRGLLYRIMRGQKGTEQVAQLLMPQTYQMNLLWLDHVNPLGGHLGWEKMVARLAGRLFWPHIY